MPSLVARARAHRLRPRIEERAGLYAAEPRAAELRAMQLALLNREWQRAAAVVPFVRRLREERSLPAAFSSLEEFAERFPGMNRRTIQQCKASLASEGRQADFKRITGGSTAEPVQIPAWKSELDWTNPDMWAARGWYGIRPDSRLFLLWGHSHLLGTGLAGWLRGRQRELYDRALGYRRFSAYDLRPERLRAAAEAMLRFRPDYVIGYSVALDLFARAATPQRELLRRLGVKTVVAAAEAFPAPDSEARLADLFDCPVAMEYGAVETNLIAHTHPAGGYRVFWHSYLVEAEGTGARASLRVTSLYPRCVPLLRYEMGDEIELWDAADPRIGLTTFRRVLGRCNDYIALPGGSPIHSEAVTHAVRPCAAIRAYQLLREGDRLELRYVGESALSDADAAGVRERLARIAPALGAVPLVRVEALERTIAGKTPMIVQRDSP